MASSLMLINYSLDPDQARQNVRFDLVPIYLTLIWYYWHNFSKKIDFEKNQQTEDKKSMKNFPGSEELNLTFDNAVSVKSRH